MLKGSLLAQDLARHKGSIYSFEDQIPRTDPRRVTHRTLRVYKTTKPQDHTVFLLPLKILLLLTILMLMHSELHSR